MIWTQLIFAGFTAIALVAIFVFLLKVKGPWGSFWFFFIIIFLVTFSGVRWLRPAGFDFGGLFWIPSLVVAVVIALLIAALTPRRKRTKINNPSKKDNISSKENPPQSTLNKQEERAINSSDETYVGASAVYWVLIILLAIFAIAGVFN